MFCYVRKCQDFYVFSTFTEALLGLLANPVLFPVWNQAMFALLMEDVCQFKKLIYLFGNMEKAAQTQKILLSGSSKAQFNAQFFCRKSQFFRFKVEGEWHHMQVSKKESLNLRNSIVRNCSAKQKKSSKLQSRKFQSFLKALCHLINFKRNND